MGGTIEVCRTRGNLSPKCAAIRATDELRTSRSSQTVCASITISMGPAMSCSGTPTRDGSPSQQIGPIKPVYVRLFVDLVDRTGENNED